jgi:hypothetical protein
MRVRQWEWKQPRYAIAQRNSTQTLHLTDSLPPRPAAAVPPVFDCRRSIAVHHGPATPMWPLPRSMLGLLAVRHGMRHDALAESLIFQLRRYIVIGRPPPVVDLC